MTKTTPELEALDHIKEWFAPHWSPTCNLRIKECFDRLEEYIEGEMLDHEGANDYKEFAACGASGDLYQIRTALQSRAKLRERIEGLRIDEAVTSTPAGNVRDSISIENGIHNTALDAVLELMESEDE